MKRLFLPVLALILSAGIANIENQPALAGKADADGAIRVGMADSMVADAPRPMVDVLGFAFKTMLQEFTGLKGTLKIDGNAERLAHDLEDGAVQLGLFQGVEFAWLQAKHPRLKPLMILVSNEEEKHLQAQLIVRKDSAIRGFAGLKDKKVAIPRRSREHCRLFTARGCKEAGSDDPRSFFKTIENSQSVEKALDDLADGKLDAAIACKNYVDQFNYIKPGRFKHLQIAAKSQRFPAAVIVYHADGVTRNLLTRFRAGMIKANRSERGREILGMWDITGFEPVPADYQERLDAILRIHPAPASTLSRR